MESQSVGHDLATEHARTHTHTHTHKYTHTHIKSCHLQTTEFYFFFPIWIPFIYFSSLIAMTKTFKSISNNSSKCGHHCLISYLRRNDLHFSTLKILFVVDLSCWLLLCWSRFFLGLLFGYFKIIGGSRILSKVFSASIEMIILFSNSQFFNMIDLCIFNCSCTSGINPIWSQSMIFLLFCWILFVRFLLKIFTSIFISNIGQFSFIWYLCLVLVSGWSQSHRMSLGVFLPLQFSTIAQYCLSNIGVSSSLNIQQTLTVKPSGSGKLLVERFFSFFKSQLWSQFCNSSAHIFFLCFFFFLFLNVYFAHFSFFFFFAFILFTSKRKEAFKSVRKLHCTFRVLNLGAKLKCFLAMPLNKH